VVEGYYLQNRQLTELAAELRVTQSRASQLRAEGLDLLRQALSTLLAEDTRTGGGAAGEPDGVKARRRDAYVSSVARRSSVRERADVQAYLDGAPIGSDRPVGSPTPALSRAPGAGNQVAAAMRYHAPA
jgi:RNA polymerase sigma factor for flagellar operon FliA